jgi:hypothetical protein
VLATVPVARIAQEKFRERVWPDVLSRLKAKHERYAAR